MERRALDLDEDDAGPLPLPCRDSGYIVLPNGGNLGPDEDDDMGSSFSFYGTRGQPWLLKLMQLSLLHCCFHCYASY
jgi:hypothetical protein